MEKKMGNKEFIGANSSDIWGVLIYSIPPIILILSNWPQPKDAIVNIKVCKENGIYQIGLG